jgi:hypothetical protein
MAAKKRCPNKACHRMVRMTNAGTFYAHKPYTRSYSSEFIADCPASGCTPESFHVKQEQEGGADASTRTATGTTSDHSTE